MIFVAANLGTLASESLSLAYREASHSLVRLLKSKPTLSRTLRLLTFSIISMCEIVFSKF